MGLLDGWLFRKTKKKPKLTPEALSRLEKAHQLKAEERARLYQVRLRELDIRERKVDLEEKRLDVDAARLDRDKAKYECEAEDYYPEDESRYDDDDYKDETTEDKLMGVVTDAISSGIAGRKRKTAEDRGESALDTASTEAIAPD